MLLMVLLFICILVIIQALSSRHSRRFDLTRNKRFSLASQTLNILRSLDRDVEIYAFYKKSGAGRTSAEDLIRQYSHKTDRMQYEFIDPDHKPQLAKEMGITSYGTTVVKCSGRQETITTLTEETLTNTILKVSRDIVKGAYFVQGHGEKDLDNNEMDGFSIMKQAIENENYTVNTLSLFEEESVPEDCYILIVAGPVKDYFDSEIEKIEEYLSRGGNAVFMIDPRVELPNLEALIAANGIELDDDVVIDPFSRVFGGDYTVPVVTIYERHAIARGFNIATFFPMARSVRIREDSPGGDITAQYLAKTGKSAWGETDLEGITKGQATRDDNDVQAPVPIAAVSSRRIERPDSIPSDKKLESKIVVFGDSDFACNSSFRISGNADFLLNTISFLAEEEDLISIRPKEGLGDRLFLTASQGRFILLISIILLPLAVITLGTTVFVRKRRSG